MNNYYNKYQMINKHKLKLINKLKKILNKLKTHNKNNN
jgi:hypothetical protein